MTNAQQLPLFNAVQPQGLSRRTLLRDAITPFQDYLRGEGKSLNTIKGFKSDMGLLCQYFDTDMPIGEFTTRDLNHFLDWLENGRGQPCSRKSYARRVTTLKVFFKWLKESKIRVDNPAKAVLQRSGAAPLQPVLSRDEIYTLLEHTQSLRFEKKSDHRPDLLVRLILDTGIKKSECMNLTLADIDRGKPDAPILNVRYKSRQNIYKERRIPLDPDWLEVLDDYVEQYDVKRKHEGVIFACTARNLEYVLRDVALGAGCREQSVFRDTPLDKRSTGLSGWHGIGRNA